MTTVIPFLPSNIYAPQFKVILDGLNYNVVVTWNLSALRYYINVYSEDGAWVISTPLIQSPPARTVASASYDILRRVMTITMVDPKYWPIPLSSGGAGLALGTMVDYTLENFDPPILNQTWRSLQVTPVQFSFPLAEDPGQIVTLGSVSRYLSMVGGIFTSTLIYRNGAFEVSP